MMGFRYEMTAPNEPLVRRLVPEFSPAENEVVVQVAGCGLCHTDLGFLFDGVRTKHELPLALGHEISGRVVDAGRLAAEWRGKAVIIPAVMPCGRCDLCRDGAGSICAAQVMPGNDVHGGFASHVIVPANGLCLVPETALTGKGAHALAALSVIADAVSTPYQAIVRSGLREGDLAVVVGLGGVGGFAAQIASALGATVAGIDVDPSRLERMREFGVTLALDARSKEPRELRRAIVDLASTRKLHSTQWKIFECSGAPRGQETAFALLNPGAHLSIIGFTRDPVSVRLSNLMAFDARCQGNWGCLPEHYPAVLDLVIRGKVRIEPFIEFHPLSSLNDVLAAAHRHSLKARPVLIP